MLSKNKIKHINSLKKKKHRDINSLFIAEGEKLITDLLNSNYIAETIAIIEDSEIDLGEFAANINETIFVNENELKNISALTTPNKILGVFKKKEHTLNDKDICNSLSLMLDNIQDPGNMGTIIRIADWFGIKTIYCSLNTADAYNPKVVQATMGAIARVNIIYADLKNILTEFKDIPVYGTLLDGENIYTKELSENGIIIMGNEGNGISNELIPYITNKLFIPNYPIGVETSESLNVSTATAITCAEFRRKFNLNIS